LSKLRLSEALSSGRQRPSNYTPYNEHQQHKLTVLSNGQFLLPTESSLSEVAKVKKGLPSWLSLVPRNYNTKITTTTIIYNNKWDNDDLQTMLYAFQAVQYKQKKPAAH